MKLSSRNFNGRDCVEDPDTRGIFKILTAVLKKSHVFWRIMHRRLFTKLSEELGTSIVSECWTSHGLKMEAITSSERSAAIYQSTRCHISINYSMILLET